MLYGYPTGGWDKPPKLKYTPTKLIESINDANDCLKQRNLLFLPTEVTTSGINDATSCFVKGRFNDNMQKFMLNLGMRVYTVRNISGQL